MRPSFIHPPQDSLVPSYVFLSGTVPGEESSPHLHSETPELLGPQRNPEGEAVGRVWFAVVISFRGVGILKFKAYAGVTGS